MARSRSAPKAELETKHVAGVSFTSLALHLSMLIVGALYNDNDSCKLEAPMYLMVAGGIITTLNILTLIASLTPCDQDDKIVKNLSPLVALAMFAVTIWGSIVVFGPYSEWKYDIENKSDEKYCEYTPFMFAFVVLIIDWVFFPLMVLLACCLFCGVACCAAINE